MLALLKDQNIGAVFHYIPLHTSPAGKLLGFFSGEDVFTSKESEKLIRLPVWYGLSAQQQMSVIKVVSNALESTDSQ